MGTKDKFGPTFRITLYAAGKGTCAVCGVTDWQIKRWDNAAGAYVRSCDTWGEATQMNIEHEIPDDRGGSSKIDNVYLACYRCNRRKASGGSDNISQWPNWTLDEWFVHDAEWFVEKNIDPATVRDNIRRTRETYARLWKENHSDILDFWKRCIARSQKLGGPNEPVAYALLRVLEGLWSKERTVRLWTAEEFLWALNVGLKHGPKGDRAA